MQLKAMTDTTPKQEEGEVNAITRDEKLDLLHISSLAKLKSNLESLLTLPLTHVKRTVKSITNLLMPLTMVKVKSNS